MRLAALFSTGKDSTYAMHVMQKQNYKISCLVTIESSNPDSYMYHTPNVKLASLQAEAMKLPIIIMKTSGKKELELVELKAALEQAKKDFEVDGVVTGALYSTYQRDRIDRVCEELGLKVFSPLWHMDQETEMKQLVKEGFKVIMVSVAADGLDKSWLGKVLTGEDIDKLVELSKKHGINVAGEGGEFESLVLDAPMFKKPIKIIEAETVMESEHCGKLLVKKAE